MSSVPRSQPRRFAPLTAVGLALLAITPSTPQQPDAQLRGEVEATGIARIKIAVPDATADQRAREQARELVQTVRDDLEFSGLFDVVDPSLYRLVPAGSPGEVRHEDWASIGADALGLTRVGLRSQRLDVEARLYDNPSSTLLSAHRYGGQLDLVRRVAHQISDDLIQHYTGRPGVSMTRIAFVSRHGDGRELYLMDYDGRRVRRLTTSDTINLSPVWSPDGQRLAFVSWRGRQPGIYIYESDGRLAQAGAIQAELNIAPDWSADGNRLVYSSNAPGNSELYRLDLATGRNTRLTRNPAIDTAPAFSPNGREIAFTSDRSGNPQIYLMDSEGLNVRRISRSGSYNESPAWSPRGDRLAYVSRIDGRFDIVVLDLATWELDRLTHGEGNNENPRWSPDGRHIVFASNRMGTYDIHTMRSDGSDVRRLTRGIDSYTPDWSP